MGDLDGTPQWSKFQAELDVAIEETVFVAFLEFLSVASVHLLLICLLFLATTGKTDYEKVIAAIF